MLQPLALVLLALALIAPVAPPPADRAGSAARRPAAEPAPAPLRLGGIVRADGTINALPDGWRVALGPRLTATLVGPRPTRVVPPWESVADLDGLRCMVRTEASDTQAVYVTVRIESPRRREARTFLLRWDVASNRWTEARTS
jgi:hypothetical protein